MIWRYGLGLGLVVLLAAGCATTTAAGRTALREGRPAEAAVQFERALTEDPGRLDALIGLGISRYRLGAYDEAITVLSDAVTRAPNHAAARLYLALSYLRKHDDARAQEQLTALRALPLEPRFLAQVDQTLELMRTGPVNDAVRTYILASVDYVWESSRELAETRLALRHAAADVGPVLGGLSRRTSSAAGTADDRAARVSSPRPGAGGRERRRARRDPPVRWAGGGARPEGPPRERRHPDVAALAHRALGPSLHRGRAGRGRDPGAEGRRVAARPGC